MYFWKIDKLKKEFLDGGVSELNVFIYFMIFMVFSLIFAEIDNSNQEGHPLAINLVTY
jgi:hypothetical protein